MVASSTEIKVKNADQSASLANALKVRGSEQTKDIIAMINENTTVHTAPLVMVFKYLAPTKQ